MLEYREALKAIARAKGKRKYGEAMSGSMLPTGSLDEAEVLSIVFGKKVKTVDSNLKNLEHVVKKSFDGQFITKRIKKSLKGGKP